MQGMAYRHFKFYAYVFFGVTMQNHGGYLYAGEDFNNSIELIAYQGHYPKAEQFLSLIHVSDAAFQYLTEYYSKIDREVVVVYFGDHLPSLEEELYNEIHGGSFSAQDLFLKYKVPYVIWANYDIPEEISADTSLNYMEVAAKPYS